MTQFAYRAKAGPQKTAEGMIQAESEPQAVEQLLRQGLHPVSLKDAREANRQGPLLSLRRRVSAWDLAQFTRQLSDLLAAGMTLSSGLRTLEEQIEHPHLKGISRELSLQIQGGSSLSRALSSHPRLFSTFYVSMVRMGERSGALEEVLNSLADFSEREDDVRKKVRNAMAYPALMAAVGLVTILVLTIFVIPQLVRMFEEMGQALPLPTRIMVGLSRALISYGWILLPLSLVTFMLIRRQGIGQRGRLAMDRIRLRLPIFGKMLRKVELARFGRGLGLLLKSGVPIIPSLEVMASTLRTSSYRNEILVIRDRVSQGERLGASLKRSSYFSAFVANTVSIGEESGNLDQSLYKLADTFEREVDQSIKLLTSLLEPVLILGIGAIIGFLVLSMLLPIFQIDVILQ